LKRFYKAVATQLHEGRWRVTLDGRAIRTSAGNAQLVPTRALAEAMAAEWAGQGEEIDPRSFVLRDLADYAIDVASGEARAGLVEEVAAYAGSDTLCYRADPDEPLHQRQLATWEPLLAEAERRHDVRFERVSGIIPRPQRPETLARMRRAVDALDPFALAALRMLTGLSASLVVGLAALEPQADAEALWRASELEEDWQAEHWGCDAEAEARREGRFAAFRASMRFAALARGEGTP
jgi:chaperone required for assembly of F1-ATPase